ncbi:hypothetical protein FRC04_004999 [Tulasnella sp. 424]|nr:hypothetical protein FRC04_004999 [Tulasnella sp. 424]KAG8962539.1 hypothetical protein FRC05_005302 [Tulasnella sp. 425]
MSQLPDETLRRILQQIQTTAQQSSKALAVSKAQISQKERDRRMLQLTIGEIASIPKDGKEVKMYKGVGKAFMEVPRTIMERDLKTQEKEINEDLTNLGKKNKYLEKQLAEAQAQLKDIFHHSETRDA